MTISTGEGGMVASEAQLYAMFPEVAKDVVRRAVTQCRGEYDQAAYRLISLETNGREFDVAASTLAQSADAKPRPGAAASPSLHQKHANSPITSADMARMAGFSTSRPPSVGAGGMGRSSVPATNSPRDAGGSPYTHGGRESYSDRRMLPSCDWCGKQFPQDQLEMHMANEHRKEVKEHEHLTVEMKKFKDFRENGGWEKFSADAPTLDALCTTWGNHILKIVVPCLEDERSYSDRTKTLGSLQALARVNYPNAVVYLFGSCVTGLGTLDSDSDTAISVRGDSTMRMERSEEAAVLETLYDTMWKANEGNAGRLGLRCDTVVLESGKIEDVGIRKILRTRVPIVGNNPAGKPDPLPLGIGESRTVRYQFPAGAAPESDEEKRAVVKKSADICGVKVCGEMIVNGNNVLLSTGSEVDQIKLLLGEPRVYRHGNVTPLLASTRWDASCRLYGVRNSHLIRAYLTKPEVRLAAVAVKCWSKKVQINDPRVGLLSSYAIALMFVHFLIRKRKHDFIPPEDVHLTDCTACPPFINFTSPEPENRDEFAKAAGKVFMAFIHFYTFEFDWDREVVTVTHSGVLRKEEVGWIDENAIRVDRGNSVHYHFCVEDPYEEADPTPWGEVREGRLNVTRKITHFRSMFILSRFLKTWYHVRSDRQVSWVF
eukprot:TRINITY_DN10702_c0_g1_i1.p1 TRINITY_DN10702_c0_g1~~TRINITY_DN10702_c0_g1_i1.p1  ORF type:complete len:658 (+),score=212.99 TRINITY_DN10702_c0_g1_i1:141-2114(+)